MNQSVLSVREQPYYQAFLLSLFALFVCGAVAAFSAMTKDLILARSIEDTQRQLVQVLPETLYDNVPSQEEITLMIDGKPVHFFRARQKGICCAGFAKNADTVNRRVKIGIMLKHRGGIECFARCDWFRQIKLIPVTFCSPGMCNTDFHK